MENSRNIRCLILEEDIPEERCEPVSSSPQCRQCFHSDKFRYLTKADKFDPLDIVQAFKHSKRYAEDYQRYTKEHRDVPDMGIGLGFTCQVRLSEAGKKLCEKWGLVYPINPSSPEEEYEISFVSNPVSFLSPPESWTDFRAYSWGDDRADVDPELITHIDDKLVLMIDTTYPRSYIKRVLALTLDQYTKEPKGGLRHNPEIWRIYRMLEKEKKSCMQIARELYGVEGHPSWNKVIDARRKQVERAYRRALQIIKSIERVANP